MTTLRSLARRLAGSAVTAAAVALAALAAPAQAQVQYFTSYHVTLNPLMPEVTNIMMAEQSDTGGALTWAFSAAGAGLESVLNNPFPSDTPMVSSLLIGLVKDLPNDAPGQEHIVLFMDPVAASNINHIAWGTVFTTTLEEALIDAVHGATSGLPFGDPTLEAGLAAVSSFVDVAAKEAKVGPGGLPGSIWFTTGGGFAVMAFSDGQQIGAGLSEITSVTAVPEPGSSLLWLAGLGVLGLLMRRRQLARG